jgi:uncharacterized OsmC-like protein
MRYLIDHSQSKLYALGILLLIIVAASSCTQQQNNPPTLRDQLHFRRDALVKLQNQPDNQLQPILLEARTTAEQRSGIRRVKIRGFQIESDSGPDYAGYNIGPGSPESTLGVIASDLADTYLNQAALKGIAIDSLDVTVTRQPGKPGAKRVVYPNNLLYTIYVQSPASDEVLEELRKATEENSPVFNLVSKPQVVTGSIDYEQTPAVQVIPEGYQPGLREYLKYKRNAWLYKQKRGKQRAEQPDTATLRDSPVPIYVHVDGGTGVRRLHVRQFEILHDNPEYLAGHDLGPTSQEHQLGTLTSCITHITLIQAAAQQIVLDSLSISVKATIDPRAGRPGFEDVPRYPHNIAYTVHVKSPHTLEQIQKLRNDVEAVCPIYNLLISEPEIEVRVVREIEN